MSMGAEHLGVRIQAPIQIQATPISRDCPYCFERRDAIQVSERRSVSSFRKIGDNTPALGIDRAGVLFNLFPDSKERWGSSAHPESQEVQSSFKASALPYALSFNPFNFHQTRGLVHNSGSPGCLFPHPNSQGPQEVPQVLLSGQRLRVQCSPLRSVIGSPHLQQMYECGTHSSSSPGPTYCQLPGRLGNLLSYRAAGQEQHKGGPSPLAEIGVDSEQQEELSHTHFLNLCLNVCRPSQVLGDVYTEVLEADYSLHRGPTDHKRSVGQMQQMPHRQAGVLSGEAIQYRENGMPRG